MLDIDIAVYRVANLGIEGQSVLQSTALHLFGFRCELWKWNCVEQSNWELLPTYLS